MKQIRITRPLLVRFLNSKRIALENREIFNFTTSDFQLMDSYMVRHGIKLSLLRVLRSGREVTIAFLDCIMSHMLNRYSINTELCEVEGNQMIKRYY